MKKNIAIMVWSILLVGIVLSGCVNQPSDLASSSDLTSSKQISSVSSAVSEVISSEEVDDTSTSSLGVLITSKTTEYCDDNYYTYDENSSLVGFSLNRGDYPSDIPSEARLSEVELRHRAEEYLKDKVPFDRYVFRSSRDVSYHNAMEFQYHQEVTGLRSFDFISVSIAYDGTILDFFAPRVGIFDSIDEEDIPKIDEDKLLERLDIMVKEEFGDVTYTEFKEERSLSIMEDGSFAMFMVVLPDGMDSIYTGYYYVPIE